MIDSNVLVIKGMIPSLFMALNPSIRNDNSFVKNWSLSWLKTVI